MCSWLRTFCCWLLVLSLPLQAAAAGVMGVHESTPKAAASGLRGSAFDAGTERVMPAQAPCHAAAHGPAAHSQDETPASGAAGSCLHCAVCAHAAASLPIRHPAGLGDMPAEHPVAARHHGPPIAFLTPGIERPPR
jgi:hypothetical protein